MAQAGVIRNRSAAAFAAKRETSIGRIRLLTVVGLLLAWEALAVLGNLGVFYSDFYWGFGRVEKWLRPV